MLRFARSLFFGSLLTAGCAAQPQSPPPAACPTAIAAHPDDVLGSLDGIPIKRGQLSEQRQQELKVEENESLQRRFTSLYLGVDDVVSELLMKREAERRGLTVDALYEQEIVAKVTEPTAKEVEEVYEANREQIPVPLEQAAPYIKRQLTVQRANAGLQTFIDQIKAKVDVRYAIPPPELPRFEVAAGDNPGIGPEQARITLIEFSDYECPYCARAEKLVTRLRELYPDTLRVVFRDFPLSQHSKARGAAAAAYCAHEQGKFWPYHDLLFATAPALAEADLAKAAETVGLDSAAFATCLASERPEKSIKEDEEAARKLALDGTPGLFLNGMKLMGVLPLPLMQALIDRELSR